MATFFDVLVACRQLGSPSFPGVFLVFLGMGHFHGCPPPRARPLSAMSAMTKLTLTMFGGKNLTNVRKEGKCDPFVEIRIGRNILRTKHAHQTRPGRPSRGTHIWSNASLNTCGLASHTHT